MNPKIGVKHPKMDGEKNGKPNLLMDDGGFPQQLWVFLLKIDQHLGCEMGGYHYFQKHPNMTQGALCTLPVELS